MIFDVITIFPGFFSSILEHFLAHYVSMNSFSQLAAKTMQRKGYLREWPPRAGNRVLI